MKDGFKKNLLVSILLGCSIGSVSALAENGRSDKNVVSNNEQNGGSYSLRVTGPNNFIYEKSFTNEQPTNTFGSDGLYRYEITPVTVLQENLQSSVQTMTRIKIESGYFRVKDGSIVQDTIEEETK